MKSRKLEHLHPKLQLLAKEFVKQCAKDGIDALIYMTYRSSLVQDELYAKGRTAPGKIVTNAKGGQSDHNHTENGEPASLAFDACPQRKSIYGRWECVWNDPFLWKKMGEIAEEVGLLWGGNWKRFLDRPHFYIKL